mmetsp:Transcript_21789/g.32989  ORF Transcript_21789/g.32989 Transcript_21789/m.32989 type:complete len:234 (+) Transcript_21789:935-1636(+)
MTRPQTSLKDKMPTNFWVSSSSTIKAALRLSLMRWVAVATVSVGLTRVWGLLVNKLRKVGDVVALPLLAKRGPSKADKAAAWAPPPPTAWMSASLAAFFDCSWACSSFVMASFKHLPMSKTPLMAPLSSTTGKCRYRCSIMVVNASMAESFIWTHVGWGVMTDDNSVDWGSSCGAATLRVISVSVMIPTKVAVSSMMTAELERFATNSREHEKTVSIWLMRRGFFGRSFDTGR